MPAAPYVPLRLFSCFTMLEGAMEPKAIAKQAKRLDFPAAAVTDRNGLYGVMPFSDACLDEGVQPVVGALLGVARPGIQGGLGDKDAKLPLIDWLPLYAQDEQGYANLCALVSEAHLGRPVEEDAHVPLAALEGRTDGLIALTGGGEGALARLIAEGQPAGPMLDSLVRLFPDRLYVELSRRGDPVEQAAEEELIALAYAHGLPLVATNPAAYAEAHFHAAHDAMLCIAQSSQIARDDRQRSSTEAWMKPAPDMRALFADLPEAIANTSVVARRCAFAAPKRKPILPRTAGDVEAEAEQLRRDARIGLAERLALYEDLAEAERRTYADRLEFELGVITGMGFPGYFLIVADFIKWAKEQGIPVGPGRGSGAGSVVAWALTITDLDPIRLGLLFERFLNPERVSMPDFDIDFCQGNRDRVIEYVKDKYGRDAVSQIATFGTMAAKAALRDIGRVLGMGYGYVDSIAKLIPAPPGKTVTLAKVPEKPEAGVIYARREAPELEQREAAEEEVAELLALATRVEGIVRNIGMHAGGVLIAPGRITDFCPLYQQPGSDAAVSQFDKDDVEAIGLVKFDFLGLATLTILELAKDLIVARHPEQRGFAFDDLPLDDPAVYKLFADGLTEAVFQFESRGMQAMLRDARPGRLEDLIALNAMFRPGPMENIPSFCARKNGREEVAYPHPLLAPVLSETYGIFVYQEQVMQAAQILGGYSLGGADLLRRAMGKKKAEEMAEHREVFRSGAARQGIGAEKADEIFDLMEKFAGYGFNKSHAAAYSLLAYHTAWLKVHHPAEFYAANMTIELDNTDKLRVLLEDAKRFGVAFDLPDVNAGGYGFEPISNTHVPDAGNARHRVRYGLGAIKGTGTSAIEAIVAARDGGAFTSLFDFCARVDRTRINKRAVEALIKAGAFDALHPDRAALMASIGLAFDFAETQAAHADQGGLFDFADSFAASTHEPALVDATGWDVKERLTHEKAALGFYLSGHLFDQVEAEVRQFARRRIADLIDSREPQLLAGIVGELRVVNGQRGRVALFRLDDKSEPIEAVANEELLDANRELLKDDELVIVQGKVQPDRFSGGLRLNVQQVWDLAGARCRFGRHLRVAVNGTVPPIGELLRDFPPRRLASEHGETLQGLGVRLVLQRERAVAEVDLGEDARFFPTDRALAGWRVAAHGEASVVYADHG